MHSKIWNLRSSKERLHIMERTEAHKRHLINIICAKSKVNTHCSLSARQTATSPISLFRKRVIKEDNQKLAKKLSDINNSPPKDKHNSSIVLGRNLKTYSSLNRNIRRR